jgi:hypothetical protein
MPGCPQKKKPKIIIEQILEPPGAKQKNILCGSEIGSLTHPNKERSSRRCLNNFS